MALTITTSVTPTTGYTLASPTDLKAAAVARTDVDPGPFDVVGITLPRLKNDTSGLVTVTEGDFFHNAGGVLRLTLVQEVLISSSLSLCAQTVVMQHERGHVRDNEAIMPQMDAALRKDEEFNLILVEGQEFPVATANDVKETLRERIEAVFSDLTAKKVKQRDTLTEYKRMNDQIATQCGGRTAAILSQGSFGHGVAEAQIALNAHLPAGQDPLNIDGVFGPKTKAVTIAFQKANGLDPDGVIGPKTREKLGLPPVSDAG